MDIVEYSVEAPAGRLGQPGRLPGRPRPALSGPGVLHRRGHDGPDPEGIGHPFPGPERAEDTSPIRRPRWQARVLAVCSCTIVPLFAGIYRKGAGLGPAITFLFFAPAANILALVYTGRHHRRGPRLRPPLPVAHLRHRHRDDHGPHLPPRRTRPTTRRPIRCSRRKATPKRASLVFLIILRGACFCRARSRSAS
ncbi:MAG: permease [Marinilabiliales bacterium]|nr:permease [Marinilabiliales bacterium]